MNDPEFFAGTAQDDISAASVGQREPTEALRSAQAWALLAIAAAINRLASEPAIFRWTG
jgi:hypothetical protein